jgi:CII-binding regulator of phage lambda lysogenization HflD
MDNILRGTIVNPDVIRGKSAYEIAVEHGFDGTEEEWLAYLKAEAVIDKEVSDRVEQAVLDVEKALSDANAAITTATAKAEEVQRYVAEVEEAKGAAQIAETNAQRYAETVAGQVSGASDYATRAENAAKRAEDAVDTNIVSDAISNHDKSKGAHSDIRTLISNLDTKVNNLLDVDSETETQLANLLKLIEENEGDIESLTDIANNMVGKDAYATDKQTIQGQITALQAEDTAIKQQINNIASAEYTVLTRESNGEDAAEALDDFLNLGKRVYWKEDIIDEHNEKSVLIGYREAQKYLFFLNTTWKKIITVDFSSANASDAVVVTEQLLGGDGDASSEDLIALNTRVENLSKSLKTNGDADAKVTARVTQAEAAIDAAATDIADLKQAMAELNYNPIDITGGPYVSPSVAECGTTVTSVALSWGLNKTPETLNLEHNGTTVETNVNARSKTLTGTFKQSTPGSSETFRLTVTETNLKGETVKDENEARLYFYNPIYYGVGSLASGITSDFIKGLSKQVQNTKAYDFTSAPKNQYVYYAVPKRLGKVTFKVNGFAGGFEEPVVVNVKNGYPEDYYVYRSTEVLTGTLNVDVT